MTQGLLADLRSRINPAYENVRGTESYERKQCADAIEALQSKLGDAIRSLANWQHQCTELQAENERLKSCLAKANSNHEEFERKWYLSCDERDALQAKVAGLEHIKDALEAHTLVLQSRLDAMGKGEPVQFLANGARFKLVNCGPNASGFVGFPKALAGRWVALVAAENDCHLNLAAPKALAPLSGEAVKALVAEADYTHESAQSKADFINGIRHGEKAHGIHAKGGQHEKA